MLHISYFVSSGWKQGHADRECLICRTSLTLTFTYFQIWKFQTYYFSQFFKDIVSKNMPLQMFVIFKDVSKLQAVC